MGEFLKSCPTAALSFSEVWDQQLQKLCTGDNTEDSNMEICWLLRDTPAPVNQDRNKLQPRLHQLCSIPLFPKNPADVSWAADNKQSEIKIKPLTFSNRQLASSHCQVLAVCGRYP